MSIYSKGYFKHDYVAYTLHDNGEIDGCSFKTYDEAYDFGKSLVVLSKGRTSVQIEKNDKLLSCILGVHCHWMQGDFVSVSIVFNGKIVINTKENRQAYLQDFASKRGLTI